jgi:hypothetical protein
MSENETQRMIAANVRAIQEARKIQGEIAATRKCPDNLVGWQQGQYGDLVQPMENTYFRLVFDCHPNLEFYVQLRYNFDAGTAVSGGTSGPLEISYGHFTDLHTIEITSEDDAAVVASRVVRE